MKNLINIAFVAKDILQWTMLNTFAHFLLMKESFQPFQVGNYLKLFSFAWVGGYCSNIDAWGLTRFEPSNVFFMCQKLTYFDHIL